MGPLLFLFGLFSPLTVQAVPFHGGRGRALEGTGKNSLLESPISQGCRYKAANYDVGEEVETEEPCLNCQCKNTAVVCKLRVCPEIPIPPPPGCIVVHKAKKCCSQLLCTESNRKISREQRLPLLANDSSALVPLGGSKGSCVYEGTVYAEGSAMKSSTLCQYCFCIRGEMKCSSPQCVIPLNGCKPKFRSYACCPTNYDCLESTGSSIVKVESSSLPSFLKGCQVRGKFVNEGDPVLPLALDPESHNPCQTCFCMGGVVRCRPLECDRPIENCRAVKEDGHCCPDRYECEETEGSREATGRKDDSAGSREERQNELLKEFQDSGRKLEETNVTLVFEETTVYPKPEQNTEGGDESGTEYFPQSESVTTNEVESGKDYTTGSWAEKAVETSPSSTESSSDSTLSSVSPESPLSESPMSESPLSEASLSESPMPESPMPETPKSESPIPEKGVEEEKPGPRVSPTQLQDTTHNRVQFISFGVEDAVMGLQDTTKKTSAVYDHMALRGSLIPPTPPKGYVKVPLQKSEKSELPEKLDFSNGASSSLYSNGHYSQSSHSGSNQGADIDLDLGVGEAVAVRPEIHEIEGPNPSRIYSKFGLQDSAHYRYRFGHGGEASTFFPPSLPDLGHYDPSGIREEISSAGLEDYEESDEQPAPPLTNKGGDLTMLGLKLSGCNIYGIMYNLRDVIHELSSPCVQCRCTEIGVQCEEIPC